MVTATPLPHWETIPDDVAAATREIKRALRERIAASGTTVADLVAEVEAFLRAEIADIEATKARGEEVWPVLDFEDIATGAVSPEAIAHVKRRGCLVVRGTFERAQAEQWDRDIVAYVDGNHFFDGYTGPADEFFDAVESSPEIYPIYWSSAQMEARQDPRMATVQVFLNSLWTHESEGRAWFDPGRNLLYPDRIRRRPPGATSSGLRPHLDPGSLDLWMTEGYQRAFRHLFAGDFEAYDPWDPSYRTEAVQYPASTMCSAFRTFQGWTALSEMKNDQGVLHTVPIAKAMAYLMLRPLLDDIDDEEMCGVRISGAFPATRTWHPLLLEASSAVPDVEPGDTAWWHCDMAHSVAPVTDQQGWGNVMYIPAAPWCAKNERYAASVLESFVSGRSPFDFPDEHYEADWPDRFRLDQLNELGRRGLGLDP
jgi:hypothetical protein